MDTPGRPRRPCCRSRRGPLATHVSTHDFSVRPYQLTLLEETTGIERWQHQGGDRVIPALVVVNVFGHTHDT